MERFILNTCLKNTDAHGSNKVRMKSYILYSDSAPFKEVCKVWVTLSWIYSTKFG